MRDRSREALWSARSACLVAMLALLASACGDGGVVNSADAGLAPQEDTVERGASGGGDWEATLEEVVPCVVVVRVRTPRTFDTYSSGDSVGTGFVVDAEAGLILTNRHLVKPGPVVSQAVFENHEEVDLEAVYRDPVHDFGFYRFDPDAVQFMDVCALELAPEEARVGLEIRVVGNDAGEKLSILSGTLARLDRPAPRYGGNSYNDFNTFYYQAASGTSGGSSGSPVINRAGQAVAINAGGSRRAASSFYLPLDRVVRALDRLREGQPVSRGTLQAIFAYEPFDELERLGLRPETEADVREAKPESVGMLVVREVLPGGPAEGELEPGDVVTHLDGELVTTFLPIEARFDARVGETVTLRVERGGEPVEVTLRVDDLHALSPASYIEVGGAVIHPLSYHQARNHNLPVEGLYVSNAGYMFSAAGVPSRSLLLEVDGTPVPTLDALWKVLLAHAGRERLTVRFARVSEPRREQVRVIHLDRDWFMTRRCRREGSAWPCEDAPAPPLPPAQEPRSTSMPQGQGSPARALAPSMVLVDFNIPYRIEGVWGSNFRGFGLIVDTERGLVVVDRDTVPVAIGDIMLTFGGTLRIPGRVAFIHPTHNMAVVSYDPALLGETAVRPATLRPESLRAGDAVWQVSLDRRSNVTARQTEVERMTPLRLPHARSRPTFRDSNLEVVELQDSTRSIGGVLANDAGEVLAFWGSFHVESDESGSFFAGLPAEHLELVLEPLRLGEPAGFRALGVELEVLGLAQAADRGLSEAWVKRLTEADPLRRRALSVDRVAHGFPAEAALREGDLLLAVDDAPLSRFIQLERAMQAPTVALTVFRDGREERLEVATQPLPGDGTTRVLSWAGATLHEPHLELAMQHGRARRGVYVAWIWHGSPASRFKLRPTRRIVEVNGAPTPDLDAFLEVVSGLDPADSVRLQTLDLDDQVETVTLELDPHFWPTWEFKRGPSGGWDRRVVR